MKNHTYKIATGILFLAVATAHFVRVVKGWDITVGGFAIPQSVSWVALLVAGYLAYWAFRKK